MMLNFSSINYKSGIGKLARLPLRLVPPTLVVPVLQGPLRGKLWIAGSSNHGCWLGSYELEKQRALAREIRSGSVVYDLGANVGFYTLLASVLVGAAGRVVAFEPLPQNVELIRRHVRLNRLVNVDVLPVAVSDQEGVSMFRQADNNSMGRLASDGTFQVTTVTLDSLLATGALPPPTCMKIDIEGGETQALHGARHCLELHKPAVFLATHGQTVHGECCRLLSSIGYNLHKLSGSDDEVVALWRS